MAYIGKKPEDAFRGLAYYDTFTGDGSTTTFDLSADAPNGGQNDITVVVDNVRQEPGASKSYTLGVDGSGRYRRITFNVAPSNGSEIYAINPGRSTSLLQVSDNAITTAKIYADAVTGAKIADDSIDSEHIVDGSIDNVHLAGSIANAKLANSSITINGTAVSLGGSVTAGTDWQAVVVADGSTQLNAVAGKGYFLDTNAGTIDVNLPTSPTRGDTVVIADYGNNFATNRVIVNTGGKLIDSVVGGEPGSSGFQINTNGAVVELVFADDTAGWIIKQNNVPSDLGAEAYAEYVAATGGTITTSGDYKIHTFTGDGCFVVSNAGNITGSNTVDYLVVAGGAGAGSTTGDAGGGGGAGGVRFYASPDIACYPASPRNGPAGLTLSVTTYPVTVGAGSAGVNTQGTPNLKATNGSDSVFSTITSAGGGGGGGLGGPRLTGTGGSGGSGGGSNGGSGQCVNAGGAGNTPPVAPSQGSGGGSSGTHSLPYPDNQGGAGGGFMAVGQPNGAAQPGAAAGGVGGGFPTLFVGCNGEPSGGYQYFSGGGAGGSNRASVSPSPSGTGLGGLGGGGDNQAGSGGSATANTGGGGGAAGQPSPGPTLAGGSGGKGIVIIRYKYRN